MPVNFRAPTHDQLRPVAGLKLGITQAAIKKPGKKDLLVIVLGEGGRVAGVFTRNRFCAAPVLLSRLLQRRLPLTRLAWIGGLDAP